MENDSVRIASQVVPQDPVENGRVSSAMANFPEIDVNAVKEDNNTQTKHVKVNGESSIEDNSSDDLDSSDCDALVIDESVGVKKKNRNKPSSLPKKGFRGFSKLKQSEVNLHSNPYFNESLYELSQLHQHNHVSLETSSDTASALIKNYENTPTNGESSANFDRSEVRNRSHDRKGKGNNPKLREYAQYLGLQPTVQFKCSKCGQAGFPSLSMLNDHHVQCTAVAPTVTSTTANFSSAPSTNFRVTRQVYLCCACGTYYENWNLFLHMREVHKRFICLYCLGMFSFPNDLSQHLTVHHNCVPGHRNTLEEFYQSYKEPCFLMCCDCEHVFSEQDNFFNHICVETSKNSKCATSNKSSSKCGKNNKNSKLQIAHVTGDMPNTSTASSTEFEIQSVQTEVFNKDKDDSVIDIQLHDKVNFMNTSVPSTIDCEEVSLTTNETEDKSNQSVSDMSRNCQIPNTVSQSILETENGDLFNDQSSSTVENAESLQSNEDLTEKICEPVKEEENNTEKDNTVQNQASSSNDLIKQSENSETNTDDQVEIEDTRKVPKVTLRLPKSSTYSESLHEESDDSEKLTMEVDRTASDNELINDMNEIEDKMETSLSEPVMQVAGPDVNIVELELEQPLDKFDIKLLLQKCLKATVPTCIYCNHARKIAVNGKQLGLHAIAEHRFSAIVNSITAEELIPESFVTRIKESLPELEEMYFNIEATANEEAVTFSHVFECFQCRFSTTVHKELYLHNRKSHAKTILLCIMCKSNFYSYSELICHLCPGLYALDNEVHFRCCMCVSDDLPSAFRLMVHLRKRHHVCDVCLEMCHNQSRLSNHVWKHKLHHLCYRCGIAYRNKPDITKHLFWKHGTESVLCKKCLQKKWPHVYHFCIPPANFVCEECSLTFTKAVSLKVHKRIHSNEKPHSCTFDGCTEGFISKKLLLKHEFKHREPQEVKETVSFTENVTNVSETDDKDNLNTENKDESAEEKPVEKPKPKVDVYDLPALNLSESDSSDSENETEKQQGDQEQIESAGEIHTDKTDENVEDIAKDSEEPTGEVESVNKENVGTESDVPEKPAPIIENIWDDFKNYQAQIGKLDNILSDAEKTEESTPVLDDKPDCLDIIMKEHDYYVVEPENTDVPDENLPKASDISTRIDHDYCSPTSVPLQSPKVNEISNVQSPTLNKKKPKSPKKRNSNSSSSNSSSDSESSSCTCGSNCSCSSSSGSSSSSSDSSDSDSSTSEGRRRQQARRERKKEKSKNKAKEKEGQTVDVITTDKPTQPETVLETPIEESDLETTESDTDEDFYDKQPQKLANKLLAEKRNQLLAEIEPLANGTILETSRPSTPSLPEAKPKKKSKSKKRKKKKSSKYNENMQLSNIPSSNFEYDQQPTVAPLTLTIPRDSPVAVPSESLTPSIVFPNAEQSFSNNTDSDANLRASKRRRVPNKFYGYSSEEDQEKQHPPQPKWRKADLPSPARQVASSPLLVPPITIKNIQQPISQPLVEPISIRTTSQPGELRVQQQTRPVQYPMRVPLNPKLKTPLQELDSGTESNDSSSDEGTNLPPMLSRKENQPALYCYCRCPYDEVSEMIGCDSSDCAIEWFHFECVGIMVPPKGQWFCPDCRKKKQQRREAMQM